MVVHCDNEAAVVVLNSGYSRDPHIMHLLRALFFIKAWWYQIDMTVCHISGKVIQLLIQWKSPVVCSPSLSGATAGLDISGLGSLVQELFSAGLAPSTLRSYRSASETYNKFCRENKHNPYPACESVMCLFVAVLYRNGIADTSVKQMADWPKLSYVVRGMKKKTSGRTKQPRLPITPPISCSVS